MRNNVYKLVTLYQNKQKFIKNIFYEKDKIIGYLVAILINIKLIILL